MADHPRRGQRRYRTRELRIYDPVSGRVVNIGQRGLALEAPERLFVGGSYFFRVGLGPRQLRLSGRVQWCRLVGTQITVHGEVQPVFRAGVFFAETTMSKAWGEALKRLTEAPSRRAEAIASARSGHIRARRNERAPHLRLAS